MIRQKLRGTRFKYKFDAYRAYPYWRASNAIFIHVPKAAGTSINRAVFGRTLGHYKARELRQWFPGLFARSFVFSLTRNPWDRVVSAYRFARAGHTGSMGIANPGQYDIPAFQSFERFLFEWLKQQNVYALDFVFQPQAPFLADKDGSLMVDYLGKVETLQEDMSHISRRMGRDIHVDYLNRTASKASCKDYYHNQDMIDLVGQLYKEDVDLLEYDFE